ncbi:MAG: hypothetical protein ACYDDF_03465 [Thermoplasmatota archaeon]
MPNRSGVPPMPVKLRIPLTRRKIRRTYLLVLVGVITASVATYAGSVTINSASNVSYQGNYVTNAATFTVGSITYNVVEAALSASASNVAWSNGGTINTALVAGDWDVTFVLTIVTGAATSHAYTITVTSTSATGTTSTVCAPTFTSPASVTNGQTMNVYCDIGATSWTAPSALQVTVA